MCLQRQKITTKLLLKVVIQHRLNLWKKEETIQSVCNVMDYHIYNQEL